MGRKAKPLEERLEDFFLCFMDIKGKQLAFGSLMRIVIKSKMNVAFVLVDNLCYKSFSGRHVAKIFLRLMLMLLVCKKHWFGV
jgi:hypothetical protein